MVTFINELLHCEFRVEASAVRHAIRATDSTLQQQGLDEKLSHLVKICFLRAHERLLSGRRPTERPGSQWLTNRHSS